MNDDAVIQAIASFFPDSKTFLPRQVSQKTGLDNQAVISALQRLSNIGMVKKVTSDTYEILPALIERTNRKEQEKTASQKITDWFFSHKVISVAVLLVTALVWVLDKYDFFRKFLAPAKPE